jgi:UDP-N-acetylglucosamine 1-carboxyvinyltransferase
LAERMRASFWVAGPLLARLRSATVPLPGGCAIGSRPVDYIIQGFAALGVRAEIEHGLMKATADRLPGGTVFLDARYRSPGATFNVMMLSVLADGATTIENASTDPEVVSCAEFLNAMGARISGIGGATLHIEGVPALRGCEFTGIADRIEAGTYLLAAAATRGDVTVEQANPAHLDFVLAKLEEAGLAITRCDDAIRVQAPDRARAVDITTGPFPLFPTDLQSPMVVLLSLADGTSIVQETIYDGRLTYLDELRRMGAQSRMVDQTAIITGVERLTGASIHAHDMRAGAALVVAALAAEGESRISGLHFIQRGYQDLEAKLRSLGADLRVQA